jgi:Ca2+-transporting ATPase
MRAGEQKAGFALERPWRLAGAEVASALDVSPESGLSTAQVLERLARHGSNRLPGTGPEPAWRILLAQLKTIVAALLGLASAGALLAGETGEGIAILVVLVVNTALGFFTELRARRSIEGLRRLGQARATVRRNGALARIAADDLVPGDVVLIEGGDVVAADLRLLEASRLEVDESALTGESLPVGKTVEAIAETELVVAERRNILFRGTAVTRGSANGIAVATGGATELGRIAGLVAIARSPATPFERRLAELARQLAGFAFAAAALVAIVGWWRGAPMYLALQSALALAIAAVPEGLPVVATVAQARAVWRMARRNALVRRLAAVEALGATSVILTDKTGTLTENRIAAVCVWTAGGRVEVEKGGGETRFVRRGAAVDPTSEEGLRRALEVGVLCGNAELGGAGPVGDPLEVALLELGAAAGLERRTLLEAHREVREVAFDSAAQWMATYHEDGGGLRVALKGSPESVLALCERLAGPEGDEPLSSQREIWLARNRELAGAGLRVLGLADGAVGDASAPLGGQTFLGLVGLLDPPREDVAPALAACRRAGIRVVMVTGDQAPTARYVAEAVGMLDPGAVVVTAGASAVAADITAAAIVARASPERKLEVLAAHRATGAVVAMTGDGVNDAPALELADVGIAMGMRGTQVAREAADIVLEDDRFSTLVAAVEQGRVVFDNVRSFTLYLLACNLSEILVVGAAAASGRLLLSPLQILFLNLVTDVFPAFALGFAEGGPGVLLRPPRSARAPIVGRGRWLVVLVHGAILTAATLGAFALAAGPLGLTGGEAASVAFLTLGLAQLAYVFEMRHEPSPVRNEVTRNPWVWAAVGLCGVLLFLAAEWPALARWLAVSAPGAWGWRVAMAMGLLPLAVLELGRALWPRRGGAGPGAGESPPPASADGPPWSAAVPPLGPATPPRGAGSLEQNGGRRAAGKFPPSRPSERQA